MTRNQTSRSVCAASVLVILGLPVVLAAVYLDPIVGYAMALAVVAVACALVLGRAIARRHQHHRARANRNETQEPWTEWVPIGGFFHWATVSLLKDPPTKDTPND